MCLCQLHVQAVCSGLVVCTCMHACGHTWLLGLQLPRGSLSEEDHAVAVFATLRPVATLSPQLHATCHSPPPLACREVHVDVTPTSFFHADGYLAEAAWRGEVERLCRDFTARCAAAGSSKGAKSKDD